MSSKLNVDLVGKAVGALMEFEKKKGAGSKSLIEDYAKPIQVMVQLMNEVSQPVLKPIRVKIPHSIFNAAEPDEHTICLFCKSDDKEALQKMIQDDPELVPGLKEVISMDDVKKLYATFKDIKKLASSYTHFVCDPSIMSHLYGKLGKTFGARNNFPVPADYKDVSKMPTAVNKAINGSTYMHMAGKNITIKLGLTNMTKKKVAENVTAGVEFAVAKLRLGWKDVHSLGMKTSDSVTLPIYSKFKNEQLAFVVNKGKGAAAAAAGAGKGKGKATKKEKLAEEEDDEEDDDDEEEVRKETAPSSKGKKASSSTSSSSTSSSSKKAAAPAKSAAKKKAAAPSSDPSPIKAVNSGSKAKGIVVKKKAASKGKK
jgi:ribosome biogenesis protein UTP30